MLRLDFNKPILEKITFQTSPTQRLTLVKAKREQFDFKYPSLFGIYVTTDDFIYETSDEMIYFCR